MGLIPDFNALGCPTFGNRPIEFQGLFPGLSHPIAAPRDSPVLTHKRTSALVVGMSAKAQELKSAFRRWLPSRPHFVEPTGPKLVAPSQSGPRVLRTTLRHAYRRSASILACLLVLAHGRAEPVLYISVNDLPHDYRLIWSKR
jgi:hypothetical protein